MSAAGSPRRARQESCCASSLSRLAQAAAGHARGLGHLLRHVPLCRRSRRGDARENATVEEKAELRAALGLDRPVLVQYGEFVGRVVQGDFGISYPQPAPGRGADRRAPAGDAGAGASSRRCSRWRSAFRSACCARCSPTAWRPQAGAGGLAHRHLDADLRHRDRADPGLRRDAGLAALVRARRDRADRPLVDRAS